MAANRDTRPGGAEPGNSRRKSALLHPTPPRRGPPRLLLVVVAAGIAVLACLAVRSLWQHRHERPRQLPRQHQVGRHGPAFPANGTDSFPQPAFSPQASVEDLKREALRVAGELVESYPHAPQALGQMARLQYTFGDVDRAEELWRRCVELEPGFADAYYGIAYAAKEKGQYATAVELFRKVSALSPGDPRIPFLLGDALMKEGKMEEAVVVLKKSVQAHTASAATVVCLGQAYLQLRQYERAKQVFQAAIDADPTQKQAYYGLATAYARLGQKDHSRQLMEKFSSMATKALRDHGQRIRAFGDLVSIRQIATQTLNEAARVYLQHANPEKAEEMWRRAALLDPNATPCRTHLAQLYEQHDRLEEALAVCRQLARIDPQNADYWFNVGVLAGRLDHAGAALEAIRRAVQLDPHNTKYRQAYDLIQKSK